MQAFQEYIASATSDSIDAIQATVGGLDAVDFHEPGARDTLNFALSDITDNLSSDPVVAYERVRAVMADAGFLLPPSSSLLELFSDMENEGDKVFALTRQTPLSLNEPEGVPCYLYFAFCMDDFTNTYDVLAEVVTQEELEEILEDSSD